ncbi:MAG: ThuA domain-containing protein [Verrucomicrobiae bacterium]|nr:ThuA domain-containing protein [Verrucomicrobiae bacterium]
MKRIVLTLVCAWLAAVGWTAADVLIVADEFPAMEIVAQRLKQDEGIVCKIVKQDEMPAALGEYSAVVVYVHKKLADAPAKAMVDYTNAGGKLVALHHSISSGKRENKHWMPFLGIDLPKADVEQGGYKWIEPATLQVVNLAPGHFITTHKVSYETQIAYRSADTPVEKQRPGFTLRDSEVYLNHAFIEPRTVLLGMKYTDAKTGKTWMQDRAGWLKPSGKGWIVYLMPGHRAQEFQHPTYSRIVTNAVIWKP